MTACRAELEKDTIKTSTSPSKEEPSQLSMSSPLLSPDITTCEFNNYSFEHAKILRITSRGGHQITFQGRNGEDQLEICSKGGYNILFEERSPIGPETIIIKRSSRNKINLEIALSDDSINISSDTDLNIKAANIEIAASETLTLRSASNMTINGSLIRIN